MSLDIRGQKLRPQSDAMSEEGSLRRFSSTKTGTYRSGPCSAALGYQTGIVELSTPPEKERDPGRRRIFRLMTVTLGCCVASQSGQHLDNEGTGIENVEVFRGPSSSSPTQTCIFPQTCPHGSPPHLSQTAGERATQMSNMTWCFENAQVDAGFAAVIGPDRLEMQAALQASMSHI